MQSGWLLLRPKQRSPTPKKTWRLGRSQTPRPTSARRLRARRARRLVMALALGAGVEMWAPGASARRLVAEPRRARAVVPAHGPPLSVSLPFWPSSSSWPSLPMSVSLPAPPQIRSFPPRPDTLSFPLATHHVVRGRAAEGVVTGRAEDGPRLAAGEAPARGLRMSSLRPVRARAPSRRPQPRRSQARIAYPSRASLSSKPSFRASFESWRRTSQRVEAPVPV